MTVYKAKKNLEEYFNNFTEEKAIEFIQTLFMVTPNKVIVKHMNEKIENKGKYLADTTIDNVGNYKTIYETVDNCFIIICKNIYLFNK